jgi:hypothetical protein
MNPAFAWQDWGKTMKNSGYVHVLWAKKRTWNISKSVNHTTMFSRM